MYSVVLLMAMSSGAEMPAWGHRGHGCNGGCYGGGYGACTGAGYGCSGSWGGGCHGWGGGGCSGYSCGGGGGCHGGHRLFGGGGLFHRGGHGCHGASYSCCGGPVAYSCGGGGACYGGGAGCYGGAPMMAPPPAGAVAPAPKPKDMPPPPKPAGEKKEVSINAPATIIVTLPADAKLLFDGNATTSTSNVRRFTTPELTPGQEFHYQLKAEAQRDGEIITTTKEIAVRAGQETRVDLQLPLSVVQK